jgi:beta-lactamase class A
MTRKAILLCLAWLGLLSLAGPAPAQAPGAALRERAEQVVALLRGGGNAGQMFAPAFLAQVPEAQIRGISQQLTSQYGAPQRVEGIDAQSATSGTVHVAFERAILHLNMVLEPQSPHLIAGLLVAGADMRGDSLAAVLAEMSALPGQTSIAVARLGEGAPALTGSIQPERPLAIGSSYKLWILAELSRQIRAGERRWSDVVTLDRRSIPTGVLQTWPRGAPVTLHTLAAQMISISDNTATDMLLHTLGRENVERMMATIGISTAARNRPLLSTLELAAIKTAPAPALNLWRQADEAGRRALLASTLAEADAARIDPMLFAGNPLNIDVEWYASASDMVRTMDWLRRHGDETMLAILSINPGVGPSQRAGFAYVGYKGGSEPGVLSLNWLVRGEAGAWHVVTGSWNNPAAPLDEARFVGLMARAVQLAR